MRVAIATCSEPQRPDADIPPLGSALRKIGSESAAIAWTDPDADWAGYDRVLLSSTWDYDEHPEEFRRWIGDVAVETELRNRAELIEWNLDKRYLRELGEAGVPVIDTIWTEPGGEVEAFEAACELGWEQLVAKPAVDLGAKGLHRTDRGGCAAALRAIDAPALLQPFLHSLVSEGELSLVMIAGELSHVVRKRPGGGDFRVQPQYGGTAERIDPTPEAADLARAAIAAAPQPGLYARVDLVRASDGSLRVIELEMIEPALYLELAPEAAERLALAIASGA